jgi:hypothetical protein
VLGGDPGVAVGELDGQSVIDSVHLESVLLAGVSAHCSRPAQLFAHTMCHLYAGTKVLTEPAETVGRHSYGYRCRDSWPIERRGRPRR